MLSFKNISRLWLTALLFSSAVLLSACGENGKFMPVGISKPGGNTGAIGQPLAKEGKDEGKPDVGAVTLDEKGLPTLKDLSVAGPLGEMALGSASAPNTIIEYVSLTCPYCRAFHLKTFPQLKKRYIDTGKLRYIVREFPIGWTSGSAAIISRCENSKYYFKLIDLFLTQQKTWVGQKLRPDDLYKVAGQSGLSRARFNKCLADKTLASKLNWVKERGRKLGVSGTPTFFINGQKRRSVLSLEEIEKLLKSPTNS